MKVEKMNLYSLSLLQTFQISGVSFFQSLLQTRKEQSIYIQIERTFFH
jgi:hypothetical protein